MEMASSRRNRSFREVIALMEQIQVAEVTLAALDLKDRIPEVVSTGEILMDRGVREAAGMELEVTDMEVVVETVVETRDTAVELTKVREAREMVKALEVREAQTKDLVDQIKDKEARKALVMVDRNPDRVKVKVRNPIKGVPDLDLTKEPVVREVQDHRDLKMNRIKEQAKNKVLEVREAQSVVVKVLKAQLEEQIRGKALEDRGVTLEPVLDRIREVQVLKVQMME